MPAASPVAFPVMTPAAAATASPLGVRSQRRAAPAASALAPVPATEPSNVATDLASGGVEETAPPRRMRRQTVAPGQPAAPEPPRASDAEKATLAGEHASVLQAPVQVEPVLAPRRTRRQTMAAGALAHMPANDGGASAPAVVGKLVKRARRQTQAAPTSASAEMAAGGSTGEQAMPSIMEEDKAEAEPTSQGYGEAVVSASQTAKLPQIAEEPSKTGAGTIVSQSCAPVPARRTRRQTMAHVVPEASSGPASAGTDRQRELGCPEAAQAAAPQLPSITEDEPEDDAAESAPAAEPTSAAAAHEEAAVGPAMHVRSDEVLQEPRAQSPAPDCLPEASAQPAAVGPRRTRRQTITALVRPAGLGRSLLSAATGRPRSSGARPALLPPLPEEAATQPPSVQQAASSKLAAVSDAQPATEPSASDGHARAPQPRPGRTTRRQTIVPAAPTSDIACQLPDISPNAGSARGRKRKSPAAVKVAGAPAREESEAPSLPQGRDGGAAPGMRPAADAHEELLPKQRGVNKRQKAVEKKATAKISRPGSASDKENAPAARGRPQSGRR